MASSSYPPAEATASWPHVAADCLGLTRLQVRRLLLTAVVTCALAVRGTALATYGFSEDEAAKVQAVEAYRRGDFTANAEHPMLMKLAMWGSLEVAQRWNRYAALPPIAPEAALRLPNVIAGTATAALVFGVVELLFSLPAAVAAALIVALDPNVIAINRIGKEDTFLMLFFFAAVWCYEHAKSIGERDLRRAQSCYVLSGAAFGLMLASKYMPHFFGLYALFNVVAQPAPGRNKPPKLRYYGAMAAAFLGANFIILAPSTWAYAVDYLRGRGLMHHGSFYQQRLYVTNKVASLDGLPITYYVRMIATKVPLPVLAAAIAGLVPLARRHRERGFIWLRVLLLPLLVSYSLMAAKFQRYALPILLLVDILAAVGVTFAVRWLWRQRWPQPSRLAVCVAVYGALFAALLAGNRRIAPFYSTHQNAIGAMLAAPVSAYPEEAYDYGVREAVNAIAEVARPDAVLLSDATRDVAYYVAGSQRPGLRVASLAQEGLSPVGERWVLVQDDHVYFENAAIIGQLRRAHVPWRQFRIGRSVVLQVFRLGPDGQRR
jgi:4-amino-4-deoxy-L-arabinose transferase-like glycosyltransferase